MTSSVINGKVLDWHWKKRETDSLFYVGDILMGQLFHHGRSGWTALRTVPFVELVEGFKTRYSASNFLLKTKVCNHGQIVNKCTFLNGEGICTTLEDCPYQKQKRK